MDMVYTASDYCVRPFRRSIVETESVGDWQEFHVLDEHAPATGIILDAAAAVGMDLTRLEDYCWISGYVLGLLLTGKGIGHAEAIAHRQQLLAHPAT